MQNTKASDPRTQTRRENKVSAIKARLKQMKEEKTSKEVKLKKLKKELEDITNKYEDKIREKDQYDDEFEEKKALYDAAIVEVSSLTGKIVKNIRTPYNLSASFGIEVLELKNNLDKVKLPESTAKEFFYELSKEKYCVCGRELDEQHRKSLEERASHYMGSDEMNFLNIMKSEITNQIIDEPKTYEENFKNNLKSYRKAIQDRQKAKTDLEALEEAIIGGDSTILDAKQKKDELESNISVLEEDIKKYKSKDDSQDDDRTFSIEVLEKRLVEAEKKLAEITKTVSLKKKTDILNQIITDAHQKAMKNIIETIRNDANNRIHELLPNNNIKIANIDKALKLEGQEAGSVGETLSVAYAFMATLFSNTERELPFIVDSPANSIDNRVREEVAKLIPNLTNQFIAFTISSERGHFVKPLEQASNGQVNYITIFRQGDKELEELASQNYQTALTEDGVIVHGKEFFGNFHKNSEEEVEGFINV